MTKNKRNEVINLFYFNIKLILVFIIPAIVGLTLFILFLVLGSIFAGIDVIFGFQTSILFYQTQGFVLGTLATIGSLFFYGMFIIGFIVLKLLELYSNNLLKKLNNQEIKFEKSKKYSENIEEIIEHLEGIYKTIKTISYFKSIVGLLGDIESYNHICKKLAKKSQVLIKFINNLRSDLSIHLIEQQQILEGAKSAVEENIKGTTELNQVSELQRMRLDRQIEQFEELQRVLVKV